MPATLTIRTACADQKNDLEALQREASLAWEDYREALLAHPDAIEVPVQQLERGDVLVASDGGRTLGFVAIEPRGDGDIEIDGLFVLPAEWRQGIGRSLLEAAEAIAVARNAETLYVVANPRAEEFYRRCGFTLAQRVQTRFGPAHSMIKSVPRP